MEDRTILHCDLNAFYASVECIFRPELREVPMAVCGSPENRHGIILAKNELAKGFGVKTAETVWQAKKKCPHLTLVGPHHDLYAQYSVWVNEIYRRYTDQVEPFGIDESWLDVTGSRALFGGGKEIADAIRARVRNELELTVSVGVSFNKVFAKLGSDYKKPDATTVIGREDVARIVHPLPVRELLFVGRAAQEALNKAGVRTIGDLARRGRGELAALLGKQGDMLYAYATGGEDAPVLSAYEEHGRIKSVGNGMTFRRDLLGYEDILVGVVALCDTVAGRLRAHKVRCQALQVSIKSPELKVISRQRQLEAPTHISGELIRVSMDIIRDNWSARAPVRALTITGISLLPDDLAYRQMNLFEDPGAQEKKERLEGAVDKIRGKHGRGAILPGVVLQNDIGLTREEEE